MFGQTGTTYYGSNAGTSGYYNSFYGYFSGYLNNDGSNNVFAGYGSGSENSSGSNNVMVGMSAGEWNNSGSYNSMIGAGSGSNNFSGSHNVFFGADTGYNNNSGSYNTFLGSSSGEYNSTGTYNTYLGVNSGQNNSSGQRNVFIGSYAGRNEYGSDKLYIDNSSTSTPLIYGDFLQNKLAVNGDLGIGINNPEAKLHVLNGANSYGFIMANALETSFSLYAKTLVTQPTNVESFRLGLKYNNDENNGFISFFRGGSASGGFLGFSTNGLERIRINTDGNVGIGTTTPDEKLAVNGNIHTKEVRVDLVGWSDFVFESNYNLPSLKEVETHIKEKGHLKDIPSAVEVAKNGILLGDMNAKLLQKIEELTLYTIEQERKLESQATTNQELKDRLLKLEKYILNQKQITNN